MLRKFSMSLHNGTGKFRRRVFGPNTSSSRRMKRIVVSSCQDCAQDFSSLKELHRHMDCMVVQSFPILANKSVSILALSGSTRTRRSSARSATTAGGSITFTLTCSRCIGTRARTHRAQPARSAERECGSRSWRHTCVNTLERSLSSRIDRLGRIWAIRKKNDRCDCRCSDCDMAYTTKSSLRTHYKIKHLGLPAPVSKARKMASRKGRMGE